MAFLRPLAVLQAEDAVREAQQGLSEKAPGARPTKPARVHRQHEDTRRAELEHSYMVTFDRTLSTYLHSLLFVSMGCIAGAKLDPDQSPRLRADLAVNYIADVRQIVTRALEHNQLWQDVFDAIEKEAFEESDPDPAYPLQLRAAVVSRVGKALHHARIGSYFIRKR